VKTWWQLLQAWWPDNDTDAGLPSIGAAGTYVATLNTTGRTASWALVPAAGDLDDLADVDTTGVADGDVLTYDGGASEWIAAPSGASGYPPDSPDEPPGSPNAIDDEFNDAANMSGPVNGLDAQWSWVNQGSATATFANDSLKLYAPSSATDSLRQIEMSAPAGSWTLQAKLTSVQDSHADILFTGGRAGIYCKTAGGVIHLAGTRYEGTEQVMFEQFTNATTYASDHRALAKDIHTRWTYVQLAYDSGGGTLTMSYSWTGIPGTFFSLASTSMTPDKVGIATSSNHASNGWAAFVSWWRRTA
jgi:hypothetical protein